MAPLPGVANFRNAVASTEGFNASPTNLPTRNNNPGDLKDTSGNFVTYPTADAGVAALDNKLTNIGNGSSTVYSQYAQTLGKSDSSQLTVAELGQKYAPNQPEWVNNMSQKLGVDPNGPSVGDIMNGSVTTKTVPIPGGSYSTTTPAGSLTPTNPQPSIDKFSYLTLPPATAQAITGQQLTDPSFTKTIDPSLQIDTGLSTNPWYNDRNLVTGNPRIRNSVTPISFTVYLDQYRLNQRLHNPTDNTPIQVQLNCSLREITIESKHIVNRNPSRTGMHLTMWGMAPDLITGSGSTGVFMNQAGITNLFSTTAPPAGMANTGYATSSASRGQFDPSEAYRVAAQDAFIELMKLFQMNSVTWFHRNDYQPYQSRQTQVGDNAWSPVAGASTQQQASRNNDVLNRGYVAMAYKNNQFLGYFKSLNWTQDAEKPFSWEFNFVFQVERTFTALYYPSSSTLPQPTATTTAASAPSGTGVNPSYYTNTTG